MVPIQIRAPAAGDRTAKPDFSLELATNGGRRRAIHVPRRIRSGPAASWRLRRWSTSDAGRAARAHVRRLLHGVVERLELHAQRELDEPVRQPHVLRQEWPVEVRADHVPPVDALVPVAAVVAVAAEDTSERPLAVAQIGAPAVVLEPRDHALTLAQIGLDRAVADQAGTGLAHGAKVDQAHPGQR